MQNFKYRFEIGDVVDVYDGWEAPLYQGIVKNRRRRTTSASQAGIVYDEEYLVSDKYETETKVYAGYAIKRVGDGR